MPNADKIEILEAIKSLENRLDKRLHKMETDISDLKNGMSTLNVKVSDLQENMRKVLKIVDTANADFEIETNHINKRKARA